MRCVCICVFMCMHVYMCVYMYGVYICVHLYMCVCMCIPLHWFSLPGDVSSLGCCAISRDLRSVRAVRASIKMRHPSFLIHLLLPLSVHWPSGLPGKLYVRPHCQGRPARQSFLSSFCKKMETVPRGALARADLVRVKK